MFRILFFFLFFFGSYTSFSQKTYDDKKLSERTPVVTRSNPNISSPKTFVNILKYNFTGFFCGNYQLSLEHALNKRFSLEVGGGITYINILRQMRFIVDEDNNSSGGLWNGVPNTQDLNDYYSAAFFSNKKDFDRTRTWNVGFNIFAMGRYFFYEDVLDETYWGLHLQYRNYNLSAPTRDKFSGEYTGAPFQNSENILSLNFGIGREIDLWDHWSNEVFLGLGVQYEQMTRNDSYMNLLDNTYENTLKSTDHLSPSFVFFYKFGYKF